MACIFLGSWHILQWSLFTLSSVFTRSWSSYFHCTLSQRRLPRINEFYSSYRNIRVDPCERATPSWHENTQRSIGRKVRQKNERNFDLVSRACDFRSANYSDSCAMLTDIVTPPSMMLNVISTFYSSKFFSRPLYFLSDWLDLNVTKLRDTDWDKNYFSH